MNNLDMSLKRYYHEIGSWLPCSCRIKKRIIARLRESVGHYLEDNPQVEFSQIQTHFGTPQAIAAAYVDEIGTEVLLQNLRIRRKIISITAGAMAVVIALWIAVVGWAAIREINSSGNTWDEGPAVEEIQ